jgi:hypothetical protein
MVMIYKIMVYCGIIAFAFLILAFLYGIFEWNFHVHKILGIAAVVFAVVHFGLFLYKSFKIRASRKSHRV